MTFFKISILFLLVLIVFPLYSQTENYEYRNCSKYVIIQKDKNSIEIIDFELKF
jgi:hypothetical protein